MHRAGMILAFVFLTVACGGGQGITGLLSGATATPIFLPTAQVRPSATPTSAPTSFQVTIVLDPSLSGRDTSLTSAWTAYAQARADWIRKNVSVDEIATAGYRPSFDEEVAGRTALALAWMTEKKVEPRLDNIYLQQLVEIYEAGFIREYVWTYYGTADWSQPEELRLNAFTVWMRDIKPVHVVQTLADVKVTLGK